MPPLEDVNTRYFLQYVGARAASKRDLRVLDLGCGRGEVVGALRARGIDAYGAEVFYGGASFEGVKDGPLFAAGYIRAIATDGRLPFDDGFFDLIVSNQVLEHVEDLDQVAAETHRVLSPRGTAYHHFPSREVIREGHIGIPMAHWFPRGAPRRRYTLAVRSLGFGTHKKPAETPAQWTDRKLDYIDTYTFYRSSANIARTLHPYFAVDHRELDYCRFRAGDRRLVRWILDRRVLTGVNARIFRLLAFMAVELRPRPAPRTAEPR